MQVYGFSVKGVAAVAAGGVTTLAYTGANSAVLGATVAVGAALVLGGFTLMRLVARKSAVEVTEPQA